jgi:type III restriction enzyme
VAIEQHPRVRRWVRNLDSDPTYGFWLPTASTRFYPDFVCDLTDGRVAVIEYRTQVGRRWAASSGGRALFVMVCKLERGLNVSQQLDAALA